MDSALPLWFEITSYAVLVAILLFDLFLVVRRPHIPSTRESALWITFYVSLAIVFGLLIVLVANDAGLNGTELGLQFFAGWLTEYSLSADNVFVFLIIMSQFRVPKKMQQELLMMGIVLALVFRAIFIVLGAALLESYSWLFYIFGAYLVYVAIQQMREKDEHGSGEDNVVISWLKKVLKVHPEWRETERWRKMVNGEKFLTPAILVLVSLGTIDLVFALDSIPAIFGITTSPFLVFTCNILALMGLRQLYFLLGDLVDRLHYLGHGIAFILGFIGFKLVNHALHLNELPFINGGKHVEIIPEIPTWLSLVVIVITLAVAVLASLARTKREESAK
ncbi:MAG: TerC/Alx family metal homeostasis membrane protein [Microbacteriaceae bacterium]|nr:TerC/Alx family metal homeostasis membrane protein [Microbacteriaceae bacterium]